MIKIIKKSILFLSLSIVILSAGWNVYNSVISYIATNLSVREAFYFTNDVNHKGTHMGGENFRMSVRDYKLKFLYFQFADIFGSLSRLKSIDHFRSNFDNEFQFISTLYDLSDKSNTFKKETAIYIPKTMKVYWDISCDSHMPPFIVPGITNMAMIEGLPLERETCYTHLLEYGYKEYYNLGKKPTFIKMSPEQIKVKASQEGFKRVIEINQDLNGQIVTKTHECKNEHHIIAKENG